MTPIRCCHGGLLDDRFEGARLVAEAAEAKAQVID